MLYKKRGNIKNTKILKRGLLIGLIIFIASEAIIRLGFLLCYIFVKPLGSFIGGLLAGMMACIEILYRPLSAFICVIFKVSILNCLPRGFLPKGLELISMGINLFFWISISMLCLYIIHTINLSDLKKRNKQFTVIILATLIWVFGVFTTAKTTYNIFNSAIERNLSRVDIEKQILGAWDEGSGNTSSSRKYIETYYPNNTFTIEISVTKPVEATRIFHKGTYKVEEVLIKYVVEHTTSPYGGWKFERKVVDLTDNVFLYIDENGFLYHAKRIKNEFSPVPK